MSWTLQSPAVSGKINLTCDAWQAGNMEGYFAVTGHWIEESTPSHWELKSALLGFTQVNNAHNKKRLGQALFKIVECVGIEHKVSTTSYFVDIYRLIKYRFRLVTSHVTTPRITAQCLKNFPYISNDEQRRNFLGASTVSSNFLLLPSDSVLIEPKQLPGLCH